MSKQPKPSGKNPPKIFKTAPLEHEIITIGTEEPYKPYEGRQPLRRDDHIFGGFDPNDPNYSKEGLEKWKKEQISMNERNEGNYVFHVIGNPTTGGRSRGGNKSSGGGFGDFMSRVRSANEQYDKRLQSNNKGRTGNNNSKGGVNPNFGKMMNKIRIANQRGEKK